MPGGTYLGNGTLVFSPAEINWLAGWSSRKALTIQADQVDSDLTDFPVLVKITGDADLGTALINGEDIRFTLADSPEPLAYEIESWLGGAGNPVHANIWVKIPSISAATGANLWIYYKNSEAVDGQDAANVWTNGYRLVTHLQDLTTSTVKDSTVNNLTLTKRWPNRPFENDGVIAKCQDASVTVDWIAVEVTPAIDITEAPLTIEGWIKKTSVAYGWLIAKNLDLLTNVQFGMDTYPDPATGCITGFLDGIQRCKSALGSVILDTWTHAAFTWDGTTVQAYINGVASGAPGAFSGVLTSQPHLFIGKREPTQAWFIGLYDEIRVSAAARSAAWLKFQYQNQSSVDNELTFGSVQSL